jgi:hypothetical protein
MEVRNSTSDLTKSGTCHVAQLPCYGAAPRVLCGKWETSTVSERHITICWLVGESTTSSSLQVIEFNLNLIQSDVGGQFMGRDRSRYRHFFPVRL